MCDTRNAEQNSKKADTLKKETKHKAAVWCSAHISNSNVVQWQQQQHIASIARFRHALFQLKFEFNTQCGFFTIFLFVFLYLFLFWHWIFALAKKYTKFWWDYFLIDFFNTFFHYCVALNLVSPVFKRCLFFGWKQYFSLPFAVVVIICWCWLLVCAKWLLRRVAKARLSVCLYCGELCVCCALFFALAYCSTHEPVCCNERAQKCWLINRYAKKMRIFTLHMQTDRHTDIHKYAHITYEFIFCYCTFLT